MHVLMIDVWASVYIHKLPLHRSGDIQSLGSGGDRSFNSLLLEGACLERIYKTILLIANSHHNTVENTEVQSNSGSYIFKRWSLYYIAGEVFKMNEIFQILFYFLCIMPSAYKTIFYLRQNRFVCADFWSDKRLDLSFRQFVIKNRSMCADLSQIKKIAVT